MPASQWILVNCNTLFIWKFHTMGYIHHIYTCVCVCVCAYIYIYYFLYKKFRISFIIGKLFSLLLSEVKEGKGESLLIGYVQESNSLLYRMPQSNFNLPNVVINWKLEQKRSGKRTITSKLSSIGADSLTQEMTLEACPQQSVARMQIAFPCYNHAWSRKKSSLQLVKIWGWIFF